MCLPPKLTGFLVACLKTPRQKTPTGRTTCPIPRLAYSAETAPVGGETHNARWPSERSFKSIGLLLFYAGRSGCGFLVRLWYPFLAGGPGLKGKQKETHAMWRSPIEPIGRHAQQYLRWQMGPFQIARSNQQLFNSSFQKITQVLLLRINLVLTCPTTPLHLFGPVQCPYASRLAMYSM